MNQNRALRKGWGTLGMVGRRKNQPRAWATRHLSPPFNVAGPLIPCLAFGMHSMGHPPRFCAASAAGRCGLGDLAAPFFLVLGVLLFGVAGNLPFSLVILLKVICPAPQRSRNMLSWSKRQVSGLYVHIKLTLAFPLRLVDKNAQSVRIILGTTSCCANT